MSVYVEDEKLTYMAKLTSEVDENSKSIKRLANTPKTTIEEIKITNFSIWTDMIQSKRQLQHQALISSSFSEVEITYTFSK